MYSRSIDPCFFDATSVVIRQARQEDLPDISRIGITSFPLDPQWNYRYPYRTQFPKDHVQYATKRYAEWLDASRTAHCMILVAEGFIDNDSCRRQVLAFSIWKMPSHLSDKQTSHKMKPPTNFKRKDASYAHMQAYLHATSQAEKRWFDSRYGNRRMDLAQLVTDCRCFRRGLATRLVQQGQQIAMENNWAIGVFASPMGQMVYEKLGFKTLGRVTVRAGDETEDLQFPALSWEPAYFNGESEDEDRTLTPCDVP